MQARTLSLYYKLPSSPPFPLFPFMAIAPFFARAKRPFWSFFASQPQGNVCYADYTVFSLASHDNSVTGERTRGALDKTREQKAKQKAERENFTSS